MTTETRPPARDPEPRSRRASLGPIVPSQNLAGTLYGTVLVSSVIVTLFDSTDSATTMIVWVVVTAIVFALAHGWAVAVERSAGRREPLGFAALRRGVMHEWGMVEAAAPTVLALLLAVFGVVSKDHALTIALIANTVLLAAWGAGLRELAGGTRPQLVTAALTSATFGLALIFLHVFIH